MEFPGETIELEKNINGLKSDPILCGICNNYREMDQITEDECENCKKKDFCDDSLGMYHSSFLCRNCSTIFASE